MSSRQIVFVGNCQLGMLTNLYRRVVSPVTGDQVEYVAAYEHATEAQRNLIGNADLVVRQVLDFAARIGDLETRGDVQLVPSISSAFLWPYTGEAHPRNTPAPILDASGPYPGELGNSFLNRMLHQRVSPEAAVARYLATDVVRVRHADRLMELVLDRQFSRDQSCGYDFADFIAGHFRRYRLFRSPQHPDGPMAIKLASDVFARIGVDDDLITAMQAQSHGALFPQTEAPLHPQIIEHFGLDYADAQTRYRYFEEGCFTFEEWCLRYMKLEWDPVLAEGLWHAREGRPEAAMAALERATASSPRSAMGRAVLSDLLLRRGQVKRAIEPRLRGGAAGTAQ